MTDKIDTPDGTIEVTADPEDATLYATGVTVSQTEKEKIEGRTVWTPEDVMEEVESLADQLSLIESFVQTVTSQTEVPTNGDA